MVAGAAARVAFETALWMRRRYRLLFALIGLAIVLTARPFA